MNTGMWISVILMILAVIVFFGGSSLDTDGGAMNLGSLFGTIIGGSLAALAAIIFIISWLV